MTTNKLTVLSDDGYDIAIDGPGNDHHELFN